MQSNGPEVQWFCFLSKLHAGLTLLGFEILSGLNR